ncbi:hypothetical protein EUX98_g6660 [Antrodiella citrinella]|uniref:tRNA ligase n=1 Tax=Antrodiella citrinella TaxID=2447956 RepID=A0A4S4MQY4_9APHY|nr:hypothetical protein EUX98_g6660 [Antrodiella citrinella]
MADDLTYQFQKLAVDTDENDELIRELFRISKKSPKLVKWSVHDAPADPAIKIRSWKMNEFKYYDIPSPFPTLARGLFTDEIKLDENNDDPRAVKHRIVARGYDKFFNIGEVPWTTWASLERHTSTPYTLTLKSNGCIIFMAALTPDKLVVTSKHSLGAIKGKDDESHAQVGERWLRKHLADAGKTEAQFAKVLWDKKWTAVAELCDDSFEEHVLPYSKDKSGLHLHGLNDCSKNFRTQLPDVVDAFAREWGFIVTKSVILNTIPEVKTFTDEIGRSGEWNGEALEGFVVRTHVSTQPPTKGNATTDQSPYSPGSSFFFKVKFDEPYMMYRDWREVTKSLLTKGPAMANVPKSKLRRPETKVYAEWVIKEIQRDKSQFLEYNKGKGIIATRERFQRWLASSEDQKQVSSTTDKLTEQPATAEKTAGKTFGKTIIVPVAIPGVGKTSIAVVLKHLFGFGHVQSDDIAAKKVAPVFIKKVVESLKTHDVVIADKNNHLRQHRQQLRDATKGMSPPVRLLGMNWSFDLPQSTIHQICGDRIQIRGENHQTLRPDESKSYEDVLWMFLKGTEELTADEVDVTVEMDVQEDLDSSLKRAVDACVDILGVERPDAEKMGEAMAIIRGYEPSTKKRDLPAPRQKAAVPRYYALLPQIDHHQLVSKLVAGGHVPANGGALWDGLVKNNRLGETTPHVTIVHSKNLEGANKQMWDLCRELPPRALFSFRLDRLLWDDRVMAVTVSDLAVSADDGASPTSKERTQAINFVATLPDELRKHMHLTVGTREKEILPFEARLLVGRWRSGQRQGIGEVALKDVWVTGGVKGLFR